MTTRLLLLIITMGVWLLSGAALSAQEKPIQISGVYPHLRMWNNEGECGTGAVVLWQGDLWVVTYAPHAPTGSSDKLYQVSPDLKQTIFEGSVGGTPANRMIHRESNQLLIGPYIIDSQKKIRVLPSSKLFGRLTANARHLTDPKNKVYYATMEEGLYSVDLRSLQVECHIRDNHANSPRTGVVSNFPGYHGKGLYSSQGRLVYANNGEHGSKVKSDPTIPSGGLGQWFGDGDWQLVRRNQFTEVTGPGGIFGNNDPEKDPIWAMGWDARSLILALLENQEWHYYRLPKGSHSYDGSHGWNTEWPRIRDIGEDDLLATMHGTFWRFPATFSLKNSGGIRPRSNYLKVIGDFCRWNDQLVLGCDDSAKAEFLNTRPFKAGHAAPKQSNSNLWFIEPEKLDALGPVIGRGSLWLRDDLEKESISDPYLFSGYDRRQLQLTHQSDHDVTFTLEVDRDGNNQWKMLGEIAVPPKGVVSHIFQGDDSGAWLRLKNNEAAKFVTAHFHYSNEDKRSSQNGALFAGITKVGVSARGGRMQSLAYDRLGLVASDLQGNVTGYYELNEGMELQPVDDHSRAVKLVEDVRQPENKIKIDDASVLLIEDGKRYRLPKNDLYTAAGRDKPRINKKTLRDYIENSITKGATVSVSSTHLGYAAKHAVDGIIDNDELRWIGKEGDKAWIELDLGEEKEIHELWVITGWKGETKYAARDYEIQVKQDKEWRPALAVKGNTKIKNRHQLEKPIKTRFIRLQSGGGAFFRVYEVAAFSETLDIDENVFGNFGPPRICREVATERDLLNVHGTFYELPARNAQGLAKVRPIATHNLAVDDFCSHNGLLCITGIEDGIGSNHIFRSTDGKAAIWAGVIDDLWQLGKPRGSGGPWDESDVEKGVPSDPFLMTGYDKKTVEMKSDRDARITLQVDLDGTGLWVDYRRFDIVSGEALRHEFPTGYHAYWIRAFCDRDTKATVIFQYE